MDATELKKRLEIGGEIERVNGKELSYSEFVERYLAKNRPVILTGLMDDWRASKDWVDENGLPNLLFFSTHFANSKVQVADCHDREFTDQRRVDMSVSEFIDYWIALNREDKMTQNQDSADSCDKSLLYLKDWHFVKEYPEYEAYVTPQFFNDDWLNLYLDKYHMHYDADCQENNDISCSDYRYKKSSVYNIFEEINETRFPGFKKAVWLECTQQKNEIIFVPSGWYHQVHNLEDTISINHNWFNAYNLDWVWNLLVGDYCVAKELIEDIRDISDDFEGLCQRNLAANTGMNFLDFITFITRMSVSNLTQLRNISRSPGGCIIGSQTTCPWIQHILLNLSYVREVALKMQSTILAEGSGILLDIAKNLDDPAFPELYSAISKTYKKLYEQCSHDCEDSTTWKNDFHGFMDVVGSHALHSNDLINLIDRILGAHGLLVLPDDQLGDLERDV